MAILESQYRPLDLSIAVKHRHFCAASCEVYDLFRQQPELCWPINAEPDDIIEVIRRTFGEFEERFSASGSLVSTIEASMDSLLTASSLDITWQKLINIGFLNENKLKIEVVVQNLVSSSRIEIPEVIEDAQFLLLKFREVELQLKFSECQLYGPRHHFTEEEHRPNWPRYETIKEALSEYDTKRLHHASLRMSGVEFHLNKFLDEQFCSHLLLARYQLERFVRWMKDSDYC